jgi:rfaE bifunctional protein nucleotidyltransferase chain/domain
MSGSPAVSGKILDWDALLHSRDQWRLEGRIVVWTNGCFDLMHAGHVRSLTAARSLGDVLVVGLNSDDSVRQIKGLSRPIIGQDDRVEMLAALVCVDAVVVFEEATPENALQRLQPDIHCKGADYAPPYGKPVPEARLVEAYGGKVKYLPLLPGISTTELVSRIQRLGRSLALPTDPSR